QHEISDEEAHRAEIGRDAIHAGKRQVPLLGRAWTGPRIGEVDAAVGLHHDVIGTVELSSLEAVRDHRGAAVELLPRDAPAVVLARDQATLQISRQPVGAVRRLLMERDALTRRELHALVVVDVAEEEIATFLPPERALRGALRAAESIGQMLDGLRG